MKQALILLALLVMASCSYTGNVLYEPSSDINTYFCPGDMCMEKFILEIEKSTDIKCAFYELNLPELIEALNKKNADVVIEDSEFEDEMHEGYHTGYSFALMHNKFCVFDNERIWSGSFNPTERGNYYNNENAIMIESKALAENYIEEFYELKNDIYGEGSKVKNPVVYNGETKIENYFCPEDNCKLHVLETLRKANSSIYFMAFSFTDEDIANLLWNYYHEGIEVKGVLEERQLSEHSQYDTLKKFSIIDTNPFTMHHKVFIIDEKIVITGSYNPTKNANENNDENILIIHDEKIAKKYLEEFNYVYSDHEMDTKNEILISKIYYDAPGSDEGKEYVEIMNLGDEIIDLSYYFLSDNKSNSRLDGHLNPRESITVKPKFTLKNTNGILILKEGKETIDYAYWAGKWDLVAKEKVLVRVNEEISENSWEVE